MGCDWTLQLRRKPEHPDFARKLAAVRALAEAHVATLPPELSAFFGVGRVDEVESHLDRALTVMSWDPMTGGPPGEPPVWFTEKSWDGGSEQEIDLTKLPPDVKIIRFAVGC